MNIARTLLALAAIALTAGCASTHPGNPADPIESLNRGIYKFNDTVDKAVAKPVAQGYSAVVPPPVRLMVGNFFSNLDDIIITVNDLLQFKIKQAISDSGRILVNSTVGIYGVADVASAVGMEKHNEDFGQTLGYWGVGSGPYIVLPILGPSTLRDSVGLYADSRPSKLRRVSHMRTRNQLYLTKAIDTRSQLLEQEKVIEEAAIDPYEFIRDAYLLRRQSLVYDGNPPRERYDDEEENGLDIENEQIPIPHTPSSQLEIAPAAIQVSSVNAPPASATAMPHSGEGSRGVHKIWVAQRTGIR
jgi:phospholipid-binding lipoprotein MlaA